MKKNYITFLSVISAFAVVLLHTNGVFWIFSNENYWAISNVIDCICSFAVPCFFMITGVNLIDYQNKYSTKDFFKKRIKKTLIPFLFWSIIAILFCCFYQKSINFNDLGIRTIINGIINSNFLTIYWFFIEIFLVYLTIPLFASIDSDKKKSVFLYLTFVAFIINIFIPFINNVFKFNINFSVSFTVLSGYLFYVLIGWLIENIELRFKHRLIIYILGIIGLLLMIIPTYYLSLESGNIVWTFRGNRNFTCVLYSIAIFTFCKYAFVRVKKGKFINIINFFGKYTFSIYLTHWYIMKIIKFVFKLNEFSLQYILITPFIIIIISILISSIIKRIPILKNTLP